MCIMYIIFVFHQYNTKPCYVDYVVLNLKFYIGHTTSWTYTGTSICFVKHITKLHFPRL